MTSRLPKLGECEAAGHPIPSLSLLLPLSFPLSPHRLRQNVFLLERVERRRRLAAFEVEQTSCCSAIISFLFFKVTRGVNKRAPPPPPPQRR